jgi:hypothetical protein
MPKFHIEPRDVPAEWAAKRLGMTPADFALALPNLIARGFPQADPDTGNSVCDRPTQSFQAEDSTLGVGIFTLHPCI